jgi:hypothetical protein
VAERLLQQAPTLRPLRCPVQALARAVAGLAEDWTLGAG